MAPLELSVPGDPTVDDAAVDRRHDLDAARPVLGGDRPLDAGVMDVRHADEAAAPQLGHTTAAIAKAQGPHGDRAPDVDLVAVRKQLDVVEPDGVFALDTELEYEPVGEVDKILVEDGQSAEHRRLAVVDTVYVGTRVVDVVGVLP